MDNSFPSPDEAIGARFRPDGDKSERRQADRRVADESTSSRYQPDRRKNSRRQAADAVSSSDVWYLCVGSGPQRGARQALVEGRLLIGNDIECDLILRTDATEKLRALISLMDGNPYVSALTGALEVGGAPVAVGETTSLLPGSAMKLGSITLNVTQAGDAGALPITVAALPDEIVPVVQSPPSFMRDWRVPMACITAGIVALGWFGYDLVFAEPRSVASVIAVPKTPSGEQLGDILQRAKLTRLTVDMSARPEVTITGYVATERDLHQLRDTIAERALAVKLRVHSNERLLTDGRGMVNAAKIAAELQITDNGRLDMTMSVKDAGKARGLATTLLNDIEGLNEVRVFNRAEVSSAGSEKASLVATRAKTGQIVVTEDWVLPLAAVFNGRNQITLIETAPVASILTAGGRRLFEGAMLDERTRIEQIGTRKLIVVSDGLRSSVTLE